MAKYHKYVFDQNKGKFIGKFEKMYKNKLFALQFMIIKL